jgi:hypothetical protein
VNVARVFGWYLEFEFDVARIRKLLLGNEAADGAERVEALTQRPWQTLHHPMVRNTCVMTTINTKSSSNSNNNILIVIIQIIN